MIEFFISIGSIACMVAIYYVVVVAIAGWFYRPKKLNTKPLPKAVR